MILVDTSVWIDHLHQSDQTLLELLLSDKVLTHPLVIEELALGSLANRIELLQMLAGLASVEVLVHEELLGLVSDCQLWGLGLSATDAHLIGSAIASSETSLWTRDKRLKSVADALEKSYLG